jgi:REP-associated tyrosine transposase
VLNAFHEAGLLCRAWVFLPNHYHALLSASDLSIVSETLRIVHSRVAAAMNLEQGEKGRKVWYRYSDRRIRSARHWASVNYVHYNPVKHGYVKKATDWSWVSAYEYLEAHGCEWLAQTWTEYPVKDYGQGWDD